METIIDYKSPVLNWDFFANDWKDHGKDYAIECIEDGLKLCQSKLTTKKN